jgi:hypothetical protein
MTWATAASACARGGDWWFPRQRGASAVRINGRAVAGGQLEQRGQRRAPANVTKHERRPPGVAGAHLDG